MFAALLAGCGATGPRPDSPPTGRFGKTSAVPRAGAPFVATVGKDHPLVGRIWSRSRSSLIDRATLEGDVSAARYVLLGEKHDAPDHHRLQRELLASVIARKPALVLEMLDVDAQPLVDAARGGSADAFASATVFDKAGWEWPLYRPIVALALDHSLPIVAGNYPRARFHGTGIDHNDKKRLLVDTPLKAGEQELLEEELLASHCGMLSKTHVPKMVDIQRLRDGQLAERLHATATAGGAVLIAGSGHTRIDRGVPSVLRRRDPNATILALAFVEVIPMLERPEQYAASFHARALPFDAVWFTPALDNGNPCEGAGKVGLARETD